MLPAAVKRWLHKPKRSNPHPLAQFFYADKEVTQVMTELNNVNLHSDPQLYMVQLNNLRTRQDHMLQIINQIMDNCIPDERPNRDFHIKFPDEVLQEHLGVQLWFAAECLVAGSLIEVHESEMLLLCPLAEDLLHSLEEVRYLLREQCLSDYTTYTDDIKAALVRFDRLFAEFELRALKLGYLTQDMIDGLEPVLMFTIPRLAIICGLMIYPEGPLNLQQQPDDMSKLFKPFYTLLQKIRDLLYVLTEEELSLLEKSLCAVESEDFFNAHTMLSSLSSLHNSTLHLEGLDESTYADGVSSIQRNSEELDQLKLIVHQTTNEVYSQLSNSNASSSLKQTPNEITGSLEASNLKLERENEIWGQEFGWDTNDSTLENAQNQNEKTLADSSESSLLASTDSLTNSNGIQHFSVVEHNLDSETDHPESVGGLEAMGASAFNVIQTHYFTDTPDISCGPTTSEQDHVAHSLNAFSSCEHTLKQKSGASSSLGTSPRKEHMEGVEKQSKMKNISCEMTQQDSCGGRISNTCMVTEDPHRNNTRVSEGENESHVMDSETVKHAVQAMRAVVREEIRSRYHSSSDMLHRLFVCISGVADQLQTNFAGDLRRILKIVFEIVTSTPEKNEDIKEEEEEAEEKHVNPEPSLEDCVLCQESHSHSSRTSNLNSTKLEVPPEWIADSACHQCMSCKAPFTIIRRRHHCRNCGKIFCSRCSSQSAPLPWYGRMKPVRVCTHCYTFHLTPCYSNTSAC
ncbi:lateral signaling target protein 2 homolog isoform X2 [Heterodontus francisci]|uniref:lateral signaling target protein 2 homolog isoform X2 n=1 Tax=Heterodontus francisci TaxID=7792 RepID=UPI00355C597B